MTDKNKVFSLIGLATRARRVVSGEFSAEQSVKSGHSHMVILSAEVSGQYERKCLPICVLTIKFLSICSAPGRTWACYGAGVRGSLSVDDAGFAKSRHHGRM